MPYAKKSQLSFEKISDFKEKTEKIFAQQHFRGDYCNLNLIGFYYKSYFERETYQYSKGDKLFVSQ